MLLTSVHLRNFEKIKKLLFLFMFCDSVLSFVIRFCVLWFRFGFRGPVISFFFFFLAVIFISLDRLYSQVIETDNVICVN